MRIRPSFAKAPRLYRSVYDSIEAETVAIEQPNYPDETKQDLVQQRVRFWDFLREKDTLAAGGISEAGLASGWAAGARSKGAAGSEGRRRSPRLPESPGLADSSGLSDSAGSSWRDSIRGDPAGSGGCGRVEHELPQLIFLLIFVDFDAGTLVGAGDAGDRADLVAACG